MSSGRPTSSLSIAALPNDNSVERDSAMVSSGSGIHPDVQDLSLRLAEIQATLLGMFPGGNTPPTSKHFGPSHYYAPHQGFPYTTSAYPLPSEDFLLASPSFKAQNLQINQMQLSLTALKADVANIKVSVSQSSAQTICSGAMALATLLLAISFVAIIIIVLAALALGGVLPQFAMLLESQANIIWAIVSASIVTMICLTSVLCVMLIKHKPASSPHPLN
ncbi:hypothetical protein [Chlamydia pecorum]|uniref:hypothetical protein n=1 Tax=Chlamydia pecorum TaxID=85991 RepID=UPI0007B27583|nr:hypothetical protein [Chlamydia pecorum]KZN26729.1 putative inclusion membrane protein C [Chlamydia pecorum]